MKSLEKFVSLEVSSKYIPFRYSSFLLPNKNIHPDEYYHELSHILQFKRNEVSRWSEGYLKFCHTGAGVNISCEDKRPVRSKTLKPFKRELEAYTIHYMYLENRSRYISKHWFNFKFKNEDVSNMLERAMKKHKKRIIKKRIQFINEIYKHSKVK